MRRSAAPSQALAKRQKFLTPFAKTTTGSAATANLSSLKKVPDTMNIGYNQKKKSNNYCKNSPIEEKKSNSCDKNQSETNTKSFVAPMINTINNTEENFYSVVWCKCSNKKNKFWEGDGVIVTRGKSVTLYNAEGKQVAKCSGYTSSDLNSLVDGSTLRVGGKELEVQEKILKENYVSGKCFTNPSALTSTPKENFIKTNPALPFQPHTAHNAPTVTKSALTPRHNPTEKNALVMKRPEYQKGQHELVDVVVDPYISRCLRHHQREGVSFLYECVMSLRETSGCGAILADEMGLGKTLQCVTLVWTLLKQGPFGSPVIKRVIVVTPGSIVKNWKKEFIKWLGSERITPFAVGPKNRVNEFSRHTSNVMIISYEMFLRCFEDIQKIKFGLIICDEAHRLKNSNIKATTLISSLGIPKRILLTGTPIQNNLEEFYTLVELANPGTFGTLSSFKRVFIAPITRSHQPNCTEDEAFLGKSRSEELTRLASHFCLRRTAEVNKKYLPPKVEHVVFIKPSPLQQSVYENLLKGRFFRSCLSYDYNGSQHLVCISALKKLCNDPRILYLYAKEKGVADNILSCYPDDFLPEQMESCANGKLLVVQNMLYSSKEKNKKLVIAANSTKALDTVQRLCEVMGVSFARLDGQTSTELRQQMVDRFNHKQSDLMVFLLSTKAGGVGLNLTGGSRLVLYDIDWNPANDIQAMARIWRDGQKQEVHVYRLLLTGTIEEKIYQRQLQKQSLSGSVVDSITNEVQFSTDDLKDLFTFEESDTCCTHVLLRCECDQPNELCRNSSTKPQKNASIAKLMNWEHIRNIQENKSLIEEIRACKNISFVFRNHSTFEG